MQTNVNTSEDLTLFLIEDDPGHADLIKWNLEKVGLQNCLYHMDNGRDALNVLMRKGKYAEQNAPAIDKLIVLLDMNMPVMDGYEVLQEIRSHPPTRHLPVIMLTTAENKRDVTRCYELGCNLFLKKSIDYQQLATTIQHLGFILPSVCLPSYKE